MKKTAINLLQAELIAAKPFWTLKKVVSIWFLALVLMIGWLLLNQYQMKQLNNAFLLINLQKQQNDELLTNLEQKITQNQADPLLVEKLATTKLLLKNKALLHQQLTENNTTYTAGYSVAMSELSQLHHDGVSLQHVRMNAHRMTFSGLAKKPEAVPQWLAAFENSTFLSGQTFNQFSLVENDSKVIEFTVSSHKNNKQKGE